MARPGLVIFSDLDGCLLDRETYDHAAARPALERLAREGVPLVLCSSKTRAEVEVHRERLGLSDPFIVENGAAILLPEGHFPSPHGSTCAAGPYRVVELGVPYARLVAALREIREATGLRLRGFAEMGPEEVASLTGLDPEAARRAQAREYDEPFVADLDEAGAGRLDREVRGRGLTLTRGGRFYHLTGGNTKGRAVEILTGLYRSRAPGVITVGLGDGPNDLSMLERVDRPIVIPGQGGVVDPVFERYPWPRAPRPGPAGWNRAVLDLLADPGQSRLAWTTSSS